MSESSGQRWVTVAILFSFMLLHQADRLLIGPLTTPIMKTFGINEAKMGAVFTGGLLVAALFYPVWGYLYDRFTRSKLIALASLVWGSTTWISAIAPSYSAFLGSRATTGVDDSSYPGIYSLLSDYFEPGIRGRVFGLLQLSAPMGYMVGMIMALTLRDVIGWRAIYFVTGAMGLILSVIIYFGVKDLTRGRSEPELTGFKELHFKYRFDWREGLDLFRNRSLLLLFAQGFFGILPWQVITYWFFRYLETERGFSSNTVLATMIAAILTMSAGFFIGGALGDYLFKRTMRGRILVATAGVILGAVFLVCALYVPKENYPLFMVFLLLTALVMPFSTPNVVSTIHDISLPEVRSSALSISYFVEHGGSAVAPFAAGMIAVASSLHNAILVVSLFGWGICSLIFLLVAYILPRDMDVLRHAMRDRAEKERLG